ncbi:hypothetical protein AU15_11595 [Marinobacter salarius]|uniref:Uncharacterized protein n=1 Tax=Marinobacter salarius TaxID=1420917 RepID=W5YVU8_9GAMM|nr:hypothetical protein AU15_11595 [Marinobacter salarius]
MTIDPLMIFFAFIGIIAVGSTAIVMYIQRHKLTSRHQRQDRKSG